MGTFPPRQKVRFQIPSRNLINLVQPRLNGNDFGSNDRGRIDLSNGHHHQVRQRDIRSCHQTLDVQTDETSKHSNKNQRHNDDEGDDAEHQHRIHFSQDERVHQSDILQHSFFAGVRPLNLTRATSIKEQATLKKQK